MYLFRSLRHTITKTHKRQRGKTLTSTRKLYSGNKVVVAARPINFDLSIVLEPNWIFECSVNGMALIVTSRRIDLVRTYLVVIRSTREPIPTISPNSPVIPGLRSIGPPHHKAGEGLNISYRLKTHHTGCGATIEPVSIQTSESPHPQGNICFRANLENMRIGSNAIGNSSMRE